MNKSTGKKLVRTGGADTYTLRSATLVEGYFPGPMRQNLRQDPNNIIGKVDFGTFGNDQNFNGPGTIDQALPDGSRFQYRQILEVPRAPPNKLVAIDDRQLASYQVGQLHQNPLSIFTTNPNAPIPGFECESQPNNYSTMINKRESEFNTYFTGLKPNNWVGASQVPGRAAGAAPNVYQQYSGQQANPNADVVYNLSMNSKEEANPFIAQGASTVAVSQPEFSGKCYSGTFIPGQQISVGGPDEPAVYAANKNEPKTVGEIGFMNPQAYQSNTVCDPDPAVRFANPLVLNGFA